MQFDNFCHTRDKIFSLFFITFQRFMRKILFQITNNSLKIYSNKKKKCFSICIQPKSLFIIRNCFFCSTTADLRWVGEGIDFRIFQLILYKQSKKKKFCKKALICKKHFILFMLIDISSFNYNYAKEN